MELDTLLKPSWGSEKWLAEGWNALSQAEKEAINKRIAALFKAGLPFVMDHSPILYTHLFALLAQLKILALQLPLQFEKKLERPDLRQRMHQQFLDEMFQAIVFTKTLFLLAAPYGTIPAYNAELEKITQFTQEQEDLNLGLVINLLYKAILTKVFSNFYEQNIAPQFFVILLKDERRHLQEADLYLELGLPEETLLSKTLQNFEELILSAISLEPRYAVAISNLLDPMAANKFITSVHESYVEQLKKIKSTPSHQVDLAIEMGSSIAKETNQEISPIEMTTLRKAMMGQLNNPGDPTIVAQFNLDLTEFCAFQKEDSNDLLTVLMMQTISLILTENAAFRNFLNFNKLYQTAGAYVALVEKVPSSEHLGTICFKDCHKLNASELLFKIKKTELVMHYCYQKREEIEKTHPEFQQRLNELLQSYTEDVFPNPIPGSYGVYLSNLGAYGYTHAASPLFKHTGLHVLLLGIEKKQVWNPTTNSFEAKDLLAISVSADNRIFDGMFPLPELANKAFKTVLAQMKKQQGSTKPVKPPSTIADLLAKKGLTSLLDSQSIAKEAKKVLGDELELYRQKITSSPNLRNLADELLLDYIGLNSDQEPSHFKKHLEKLLAENLEQGYRILTKLQSLWCDYLDIEKNFSNAYKNVANKRLSMLAKLLPGLIKQSKQF
ncbi:2-oxo acid dehydrogenase subunit E2 [Legionella sp. km772]|uniref:2-oxo acid dehydrogenase subunit E2 n=1 Tax=Legionella sp. km772 TaxID=2498111 RepID=UPI000F8CA564|nr:2-oxo acid dehydrogenase subunit E2 [Legionella sp. km772]RUR12549.1 hypothetical protein ELY15_04855 [Legionella sp. km772]